MSPTMHSASPPSVSQVEHSDVAVPSPNNVILQIVQSAGAEREPALLELAQPC